ncbi:type II toxin-antitoxin system RelE/ParE family toxin [Catenulispora rubra]|uniref:type II toxin-antitoxin system RelE/ParE family toxin n=1 Tax=Catenulispora rubra TaxID=280293 RepID=UPI001E379897|nr:type II toxin-antitoxin system RelE/ParE family toxin [Catenulispora rubra]
MMLSLVQAKSGLWPLPSINHVHTIAVMAWGRVELEPEVDEWYHKLDPQRQAQAFFHFELLEARGTSLGMPYARPLDGKFWELRFHCGDVQQRVAYWIAADRRVILLTVFRKTRSNEAAEVLRAKRAIIRCQTENHTADEEEVA